MARPDLSSPGDALATLLPCSPQVQRTRSARREPVLNGEDPIVVSRAVSSYGRVLSTRTGGTPPLAAAWDLAPRVSRVHRAVPAGQADAPGREP